MTRTCTVTNLYRNYRMRITVRRLLPYFYVNYKKCNTNTVQTQNHWCSRTFCTKSNIINKRKKLINNLKSLKHKILSRLNEYEKFKTSLILHIPTAGEAGGRTHSFLYNQTIIIPMLMRFSFPSSWLYFTS